MIPDSYPLLDVESDPIKPAFDTFDEAVTAALRTTRAQDAVADTERVYGMEIVDVKYTDDSLMIFFVNAESLVFHLNGGCVTWTIGSSVSRPAQVAEVKPQESALLLKFENLPQPYLWNRDEIASSLIGKRVVRIGTSFDWAYLAVAGLADDLLLSRIRVKSEGRSLLFFSPE